MPPAISDDEESVHGSGVVLPAHKPKLVDTAEDDLSPGPRSKRVHKSTNGTAKRKAKTIDERPPDEEDDEDEEDEEEVEDEGDDLEEDVFVVEKILGHMIDEDCSVKYKVKWEGYEKKADQTWEPEDSLREGASILLDDYLKSIGGRDRIFDETLAAKTKKRGRRSAADAKPSKRARGDERHPSNTTPPKSHSEAGWTPPAGSWEEDISTVDVCEDEAGGGKLIVFFHWKNGRKTKHSTEVAYKRCPQRMLRFYEGHVRIVPTVKLNSAMKP